MVINFLNCLINQLLLIFTEPRDTELLSYHYLPHMLRAVGYCFHPWCPDGMQEIVCLGCVSETVRCSKLIHMVGTLGRGCGCATLWCDLDWAFDLAVVTLTYKILSGLYLGNCKV